MRISGTAPQGFDRTGSTTTDAATGGSKIDRVEAIEPSRAVVPVTPRPHRRQGLPAVRSGRPHAGFLAQLIATHLDLPQTRARRRATSDQTADSYQPIRHAPLMRTVEIA